MIETYVAFTVTAILLALTPGPDVLLVVATAGRSGFASAMRFTLGLATGCLIHTALLVLGVSVLIAQTPWAMTLIACLGALYLLYLAWLTWRHRDDAVQADASEAFTPQKEASYVRGVLMNVTNPKVLLFFLALFPQFVDFQSSDAGWQLATLGLLFSAVTVLVFGGLAWLTAQSLSGFFARPNFKYWMDRICILIFLVLAVLMLVSTIQANGFNA